MHGRTIDVTICETGFVQISYEKDNASGGDVIEEHSECYFPRFHVYVVVLKHFEELQPTIGPRATHNPPSAVEFQET